VPSPTPGDAPDRLPGNGLREAGSRRSVWSARR